MSRQVRPHWSVKVCKPRKDEGDKLRLRIRPNAPLVAAGHKERRRALNTTDPGTAAAHAAEWSRKLNASFGGPRLTVAQVFDKHLAWREADPNANPSTIATYRLAFRYVLPLMGAMAVDDVSEASILRVQDELRAKSGLSPSTINLYMRTAAKAWDWVKRRGMATAAWVSPERLPEVESDKRPLTPVEHDDFFGWLQVYQGGRWLVLFRMLSETSCRSSEIRLLREGELDRATGSVIIRSHQRKDGSKRNKAIAVSRATAAMVPVRAHGELLFPGHRDPTRPVSREQVRRVIKTWAGQALPDPENIDTHSVRRSWVADAQRAGVPDAVGQRQTGIRTTKTYTGYARNAVPDNLHDALEQVLEYRRRVVAEHRAKTPTAEVIS